eukprot:TRINITY_DN3948_c0_g1_i1.p2 TRINITY_DN3948_c0_g1~~TRINITY_DN3948_c0_g1_i1.p2  ORF type:complete len:125 (+),score=26.12 TRINITY_DN3948_c0_g1_i1:642-1016(+)
MLASGRPTCTIQHDNFNFTMRARALPCCRHQEPLSIADGDVDIFALMMRASCCPKSSLCADVDMSLLELPTSLSMPTTFNTTSRARAASLSPSGLDERCGRGGGGAQGAAPGQRRARAPHAGPL